MIPPTTPILDPAIRVEPTACGTRYILPVRNLGKGRQVGLVIMLFGLLGTGFMVFWTLTAGGILEGGWQLDAMHIFRLGFVVAGLIGLIFASLPLFIGLLVVLPNHSEIQLTDRWMYSREISGPFHWTFRRELGKIRKLHLGNANIKVNDQRPTGPNRDWACISAEGDFKRPMFLATSYPRQMLIPLAQTWAAHCSPQDPLSVLQLAGQPAAGAVPGVQVVQIDPETADPESTTPIEKPIPTHPAKSIIVLLQDGPTATFAIPRAGWKSPFAGLGCFGIIWMTFIAAITVAASTGNLHNKHGQLSSLREILPILSIFWATGIGMLVGALAGMLSKSVLVATPEFLLWSKSGLFGKKEKQWDRNLIAQIGMGNSNTSVNDKPLKQLQIHLTGLDGKQKITGLLTGRDPDELTWLAAVIRQTMGITRQ